MRMKLNKKSKIAIGVVILVVAVLIFLPKKDKLLTVTTASVEKGNIESTISTSGVVSAKTSQDMYPDVAVKVKEIYVEKNDEVKKGQKILELDLDNLTSQLSQLKIQKELNELQYNNLVTSNNNGNSTLVSMQNTVEQLEDAYNTNLALYELGAISKKDLENSKKSLDEAKSKQGEATLSNDYNVVALQKQIELAQINVDTLEKQIKNLKELMVSPIDGVISALNATEKAYISTAMPTYSVVNNDAFEIQVDVKEFTARNIEVGQKVYITGDAFDGITYNGVVKSISPIATKNSAGQSIIEVMIEVTDANTKLSEGYNVTCDIVIGSKEDILTIPLSSFMEDEDDNMFVYTVENNELKKITITAGINSEDKLEVTSGLTENMTIVKEINSNYKEGLKVELSK